MKQQENIHPEKRPKLQLDPPEEVKWDKFDPDKSFEPKFQLDDVIGELEQKRRLKQQVLC